jgi:hypothetical protein
MQNYTLSFRDAIAMNNLAVSMMEKNCYQQGLDTFHEAYQLTKDVVGVQRRRFRTMSTKTSKETNDFIETETGSTFYHRTLLRSTKPVPCRKISPTQYATVTPLLNEPLLFSKVQSTNNGRLYFVRMEDMSYIDTKIGSNHESQLNVICSIIQNNLALSYTILSTVTIRQSECKQFLTLARHYIRLSLYLYWTVVKSSELSMMLHSEIYRLLGFIISNTEIVFTLCGMNINECKYIIGPKLLHIQSKLQRMESFFLDCAYGIVDHTAAMA